MVRYHLEHDYEMTTRPTGLIAHFWDTIDAIGGTTGIILISVGILGFFLIVDYVITSNRKKREMKKKK